MRSLRAVRLIRRRNGLPTVHLPNVKRCKTMFMIRLFILVCLVLAGCEGTSPAAPDAETPDAQLPCPSGQELCGDACADPQTDRMNCGACGTACADGEVCSMGACALSCETSLTDCSGSCRDVQSDRANCGACGTACVSGEICEAGACVLSCPSGLAACGGTCRDYQTDSNHCGGCDTSCAAGELCSSGSCVASCSDGQTACSGSCINTNYNPAHCGACDNACAGGSTCSGGTCFSHYEYLGEGECRNSSGNYSIRLKKIFSDLRPHTAGTNAAQARRRCLDLCLEHTSFCLSATLVLRDDWLSPECHLNTDRPTFTAAGHSVPAEAWGLARYVDGVRYSMSCGSTGACPTEAYGIGRLNPRSGYHCYQRYDL